MKYISLLILILTSIPNLQGQSTKNMVPSNPGFILKLNGSELDSKMSFEYLDKLPVFQELLNEFYSWDQRDKLKSMKDFGVDFKKDAYMFLENTDSMTVFYMIYPLEDMAKFESNQSFDFSPEEIQQKIQVNGSSAIHWTNDHIVFVGGEINKNFILQDTTFKTRYGFGTSPYDYGYNYYDDNYYDTPAAVEVYTEDGNSYYNDAEDAMEIAEPMPEVVEEIAEPDYGVEDAYDSNNYEVEEDIVVEEKYVDPYDVYYQMKDSVTGAWLIHHAQRTLNNKSTSYSRRVTDVINSKSEASFYANYGDLIGQYMNMLTGSGMQSLHYGNFSNLMSMYNGIELTGELKFQDEQVKLYSEFITDDENAELYSKMSDSKFNKKMLKHMDLKNILGYYSVSINSKAMLDLYPQFISYFVGMEPGMNGMGEAIADIIEVMIDEQAIADIFPGNIVLLCDGITKQKMTYTSYDYDENFNRVEVTRDIEEDLPSFLMMIESKNFRTIKNWMNIAVRESGGMMAQTDYGYVINASSDIPVMMHVIFKDGIVYLCNDSGKMAKIVSGAATGSGDKNHKKLLLKNNSAVYVDAKRVMEAIPVPTYSQKDVDAWELIKTKFKDLQIKQYQKDKNTIVSEMILSGPDGTGNSWVSFWETLNEVYRIQTSE